MKDGGKIAMCFAAGLLLQLPAPVSAADVNPYSAIVDRNVFNLKAPPPPGPVEPPKAPPSKIVLLGIVTGPGPKQVMFKTPVGTPPKDASFALSEGERDNEIEVLAINEVTGEVRLRNHGEEENLSLEKDGMKPGGGGPPGALPGLPGFPGQRIPPPLPAVPGAQPQAANMAPGGNSVTTFGGGSTLPSRQLRTSTSGGVGGASANGVMTSGNPSTGLNFNTPLNNANAGTAQQQQPTMSQEEQILRMEINRKLTQDQVDKGMMPPMPPTPLTGR